MIAVDAAKSLITIGVALFLQLLGAFALNYRSNHTVFLTAWPILLMTASAVVTVISMMVGLAAIGRAYRRGQETSRSWWRTFMVNQAYKRSARLAIQSWTCWRLVFSPGQSRYGSSSLPPLTPVD